MQYSMCHVHRHQAHTWNCCGQQEGHPDTYPHISAPALLPCRTRSLSRTSPSVLVLKEHPHGGALTSYPIWEPDVWGGPPEGGGLRQGVRASGVRHGGADGDERGVPAGQPWEARPGLGVGQRRQKRRLRGWGGAIWDISQLPLLFYFSLKGLKKIFFLIVGCDQVATAITMLWKDQK